MVPFLTPDSSAVWAYFPDRYPFQWLCWRLLPEGGMRLQKWGPEKCEAPLKQVSVGALGGAELGIP